MSDTKKPFPLKIAIFLGIVFSSLFSAGGIGQLLDGAIEWAGAFATLVVMYNDLVLEPAIKLIKEIFSFIGIDINPPRSIVSYYTITAGLSLTYRLLMSFLDYPYEAADTYGAISLISPIGILDNFRQTFKNTKPVSMVIYGVVFIPVYILIIVTISIIMLTSFPIFLVKNSFSAIRLHQNYDFTDLPSDEEGLKEYHKAKYKRDSTCLFWSVILWTLFILCGLIILNKEISTRCDSETIKTDILCENMWNP